MADISTFDKAHGKLRTNERNKSTTMHRHKYIYKVIYLLWFGRDWGGTSGKPRDHLWTKIINAESNIFCSKWLTIVKVEGTFGDPDYWLLVVLFSHRRPPPLLLHCQPFVQTVIMTTSMMMISVVEQLWRWPHHRSPLASWLWQDQPPSRGQLVPHCSFLSALEHPDLMMRWDAWWFYLTLLVKSQFLINFQRHLVVRRCPHSPPGCTPAKQPLVSIYVLLFLVWFSFSSFIPFYCLFWSLLTPEVAVEHLSVSPSPSSWANVEARPESSVLARLENKNNNDTTFCENCVLIWWWSS